jgi:hypothetical protein
MMSVFAIPQPSGPGERRPRLAAVRKPSKSANNAACNAVALGEQVGGCPQAPQRHRNIKD